MEMMGSRIALALAVTLLATSLTGAQAQDYPSRPVKVIVPFGAGGPADVTARQIGNILQESFGQPFVVENRTGAGGVIGTQEAVKSPPDGHTLLMMETGATLHKWLRKDVPFDVATDFAPVAQVATVPILLFAQPSFAANNVSELIALARKEPGKFSVGIPGPARRIIWPN
jgi:tripartite-type tricarboxylate transporter receptor subunit TctC